MIQKAMSGMLSIVCMAFTPALYAESQLTQAMLHEVAQAPHIPSIERATLILYFSQEPTMQTVPLSTSSLVEKTRFFFPNVQIIDNNVKKAIEELKKAKHPSYRITIESVNKPAVGIMLTIEHDASIGLMHEAFDSISLKHGMVFRFYDKKLIKELQAKQLPILRTAFCDKKPRIVIDCGHGGSDVGAVGINGIQEKDITLTIGTQVAQLLQQYNCTPYMTRAGDTTLTFNDRTHRAHAGESDLFISIHANSGKPSASGVETFYFTPSLCKQQSSVLCAAAEKQAMQYHLTQRAQQSEQLARAIQTQVIQEAKNMNPLVADRTVKKAASQVLMGAMVPAVLIEVGFVTNAQEATLLAQMSYQQLIAQGVASGIMKFLHNQTRV